MKTFLAAVPASRRVGFRRGVGTHFKSKSAVEVASLVKKLNTLEATGIVDEDEFDGMTAALRDRSRIHVKLLQFGTDIRPPYYGESTHNDFLEPVC